MKYVVTQTVGEYSDTRWQVLKVFDSSAAADEFVAKLEAASQANARLVNNLRDCKGEGVIAVVEYRDGKYVVEHVYGGHRGWAPLPVEEHVSADAPLALLCRKAADLEGTSYYGDSGFYVEEVE